MNGSMESGFVLKGIQFYEFRAGIRCVLKNVLSDGKYLPGGFIHDYLKFF